jgi:predicted DNA-binding transcriptional regulator AlpA
MESHVFISMTKDELQTLIIDCVNACLRIDRRKKDESPEDVIMNVHEAAEFLHLTVATLYSKCSKGELPVKKRSKRLYFSKLELIAYLNEGSR